MSNLVFEVFFMNKSVGNFLTAGVAVAASAFMLVAEPAEAKGGLSGPSAGTLTNPEYRGVEPEVVDPSTLEGEAQIPEDLKDKATGDACEPSSGLNIPRPPGLDPCSE